MTTQGQNTVIALQTLTVVAVTKTKVQLMRCCWTSMALAISLTVKRNWSRSWLKSTKKGISHLRSVSSSKNWQGLIRNGSETRSVRTKNMRRSTGVIGVAVRVRVTSPLVETRIQTCSCHPVCLCQRGQQLLKTCQLIQKQDHSYLRTFSKSSKRRKTKKHSIVSLSKTWSWVAIRDLGDRELQSRSILLMKGNSKLNVH